MKGGGTAADVTVIGAGIVGLATALYLQRDGHRVTIIDPRQPGTATSFGNAGAIVPTGIVPTGTPGVLRRVPRMLTDPMSPLTIRWRHLPRLAPWLVRFIAASRDAQARRIARELWPLTRGAVEAHRTLLRAAGIEGIVKPVGWLKVYRDEADLAGTAYDRELLDAVGARYEVLSADALRQMEPGLSRDFVAGLFFPDAAFASTPHALAEAYARNFVARGGRLVHEEVRRIEIGPGGAARLVTDRAIHPVENLVLAAGAWSAPLARQLGSPVPLESERGYHLNLAWKDGPVLTRPTVIGGPQFVLCPMADGLRMTAGIELAGLDAPADFRRIRALLPLAQSALPGLSGEITREWMGHRPSTPDSKPVIGRSPRHRNVCFAFGHGHMGLSLAAVTGRLIADVLAGRTSDDALAPFSPTRFRAPNRSRPGRRTAAGQAAERTFVARPCPGGIS